MKKVVLIALFVFLVIGKNSFNYDNINQSAGTNVKPFKLIKMSQEDGAKCLDGTPPSIYLREGDPNKFLFYFQGGGWCRGDTLEETIADCADRAKNGRGTSNGLDEFKYLDGIFNGLHVLNPDFSDYTEIHINYCDGTGHQGYRKDSVTYNDQVIWFRGERNTIAILEYAKSVLGMDKAQKVVVSGTSAGGLATYTWVDYIANDLQSINPSVSVQGLADAGLFLNFRNVETGEYTYQDQMRNMFMVSNSEIDPVNKDCVHANPGPYRWRCMFVQYLLPHVKTPTLMINSGYDSWAIPNILGIKCVKGHSLDLCSEEEMKHIVDYHDEMVDLANTTIKHNQGFGAFIIACVNHDFLEVEIFRNQDWEVPAKSGVSAMVAADDFINYNYSTIFIDQVIWPNNQPCAYHSEQPVFKQE